MRCGSRASGRALNLQPDALTSVARAARIVLRPIGNPLPLGLLALAAATLLVSGLQLGWLQPTEGSDVALILIAFVFPLQLLVAVFGYLGRDVVAGTGMGSSRARGCPWGSSS
jgi:succinate-acetate transporter protein